MKIYTSVVIDIASGATLYEESYEHSGAVALCKGGDNEIKETAEEKALAKISAEQWNQYQERFRPFEDQWIADTKMDAGDQAKMAGQVNAGVGAAFDERQATAETANFNAGMDPSSGRFKAAVSGLSEQRGTATAKATTAASQAVDDQTYQGLQSAVAMGRGQSAEALRDMTSLASDATAAAIGDAQNAQNTRSSYASSAMTAVGMGLAGWKNRTPETPKTSFSMSENATS